MTPSQCDQTQAYITRVREEMIGRRVLATRPGLGASSREEGEVISWDPFTAGMCDIVVRFPDGYECAYGSSDPKPVDGKGPLPSKVDLCRLNDVLTLAQLQGIRAQHVEDTRQHKPWPGAEHGKTIIGQALDGAIADVKGRLP